MGLFSKDIKDMNDLFAHQLKDIYYAENRIVATLPKMIQKASTPELKEGFETHLDQTKVQIQQLDKVFDLHGLEPESIKCPAIDGIIKEAEEVAGEIDDKKVLDAALIAAAQAVEHYEITRYGTLIAWAKELGADECAALLQETLEEERDTDRKLTALAESEVNSAAA